MIPEKQSCFVKSKVRQLHVEQLCVCFIGKFVQNAKLIIKDWSIIMITEVRRIESAGAG